MILSRLPRCPELLAVLAVAVAVAFAALAAAAPGAPASLTIRGAGFGHGIGMSQYGAYGMALRGWSHERILRHYYTGTSLGRTAPGRLVRVLLQSSSSPGFTGARRAGGRALDPAARYFVRRAAGGRLHLLTAGGRRLASVPSPLRATGRGPVVLLGTAGNGRTNGAYRGALAFHASSLGSVLAVNELALDDYLRGVVPDESPPSWPLEALKAQAVAARSYAVTTSKGGAGWDHYADTRSQVYGGVAAEEASTNRAVAATSGEVVTYGGEPVTTYFFSTSGGRTENIENAWPGAAPRPWLKSVRDPYDDVSPRHRWGPIRFSMRAAAAKLGGLVEGRFRGIDVIRRGRSPRVVYADVVGSRGRTRVTGPELRTRFGLYDTWMRFSSLTRRAREPRRPAPVEGTNAGGTRAATAARTRPAARAIVSGHALGIRASRVRVQQRVGARWVTVAAPAVSNTGRYDAPVFDRGLHRVTAPGAGAVRLRVR